MREPAARVAISAVAALLLIEGTWQAARYRSGPVPMPPSLVVGSGTVLLEVSVSSAGTVAAVRPLRATPPFTALMEDAVRAWRFDPAVAAPASAFDRAAPKGQAVASKALVGAVFRPPALTGPTLGTPTLDVGTASDETPFPIASTVPPFPVQAISGGAVLVEMHVDRSGDVTDVAAVASAPPFDAPALAAARQWRFRPAIVGGTPTPALVYIVFGFPAPVVVTLTRPGG